MHTAGVAARCHTGHHLLQADFQQIDTLGLQPHHEERQYDVATCMFAMHYFFNTKECLQSLLDSIAHNLKEGERPSTM